jgi:hypothetical protein
MGWWGIGLAATGCENVSNVVGTAIFTNERLKGVRDAKLSASNVPNALEKMPAASAHDLIVW